MYPIMLPGPNTSNDGFSSFRNPDDFSPERQGTPPDRLGWLFVRFLEVISDNWNALRGRHEAPASCAGLGDAPLPSEPGLTSR